jgi:para-nitrobenzyl esterase
MGSLVGKSCFGVIMRERTKWYEAGLRALGLGSALVMTVAFPSSSFAVSSTGAGGAGVNMRSGPIRGDTEDGVFVFRGVRYAEPPTGALRFHPPALPKPWTAERPALDFAPACPQMVDIDPTENSNSVMAEDCLAVNVWTPKADAKKRPVMVFIHGGAFIDGSDRNTWYDGTSLAKRGDVVVVTLQYRLGALGFLELSEIAGKEYAQSGNLGILDQIAALKWIHENISMFGGNPENVTIFGESVGATSVGILMVAPGAQGLFQKAILESNSAVRVGHSLPKATELARDFMKVTGANDVQALQAMSMQEIRQAQEKFFGTIFVDSSFGPTWDGIVIPDTPMKMILAGRRARVPVLLGTNLDEIQYWATIEGRPLKSKPEPLLEKQVSAIVGGRAKNLIETYRKANDNYGDLVIHLETDLLFRMTSIRMAEVISATQPTYMYLFTYRSSSPIEKYESAHSMELLFVFGVTDQLDAIAFTGRDAHRQALSEQMQQAWISFARTGDPNHAGLPHWPRYEATTRATMELGETSRVVNDPQAAQREVWNGVPFDGVTPTVPQVAAFLSENQE